MSIKNDFNARLISGNEPFKEITAGMDRNCKGKLEEHTSVFLNNGTSSN